MSDVTPTKSSATYLSIASSTEPDTDGTPFTNKLYRSVGTSTEADTDETPLTNKLHEPAISPSTGMTTTEFYTFKKGQPLQKVLIEVPLKPYYKPLPAGWVESKGHWAYGFPCNDSLLSDFATQYAAYTGQNISTSPLKARKLIAIASGYHDLSWLSLKADKKAIADGLAARLLSGRIAVKVIILSCTASPYLFKRRPTEEQFERLTSWFGEPRWFEDTSIKSEFPFDLVM